MVKAWKFCLIVFVGVAAQAAFPADGVPPVPLVDAQPQGGLVCELDHLELGEVVSPAVREGFFEVRNAGNRVVRITGIAASCGCTKASASKDVVSPGDTVKISFRFDSHGFSGGVRKVVTVTTDTPGGGTLALSFHATVSSAYYATPKQAFLTTKAVQDGGAARSVDFRFVSSVPTRRVAGVALAPADTPLGLTWSRGPKGEVRGRITLNPSQLPESFTQANTGAVQRARVVVTAEDGAVGDLDVVYQVTPQGLLMDAKVNLGVMKAGTPVGRMVFFTPPDGKPCVIQAVQASSARITVEAPSGANSAVTHEILVLAPEGFAKGAIREHLSIQTDRGVFTIPFYAMCF